MPDDAAATPENPLPGRELTLGAPERSPSSAAVGGDLQRLAGEAAAIADAAMAPATRRAYDSAWRAFTTWCAAHGQPCDPYGQPPRPASAAAVLLYLTDRSASLKFSSLTLHRAAIDAVHRDADVPKPDSAALRRFWAGARRQFGRPPNKKRAITTAELRRALKKTPAGLGGLRDRALVLVGFASALRRSELAALELETHNPLRAERRVRFVPEGLEIALDRSKGDQTGRGQVVAVPRGRHAQTCPVVALTAWLAAARITEGPVFRSVDRFGRVGTTPIDDRTVARVVKAMATRAGLDARLFAAHSLRSGSLTEAYRAGADAESLQRHARHAKWDTTRGYIQVVDRFKNNAAGKLGL